MPASVGRALRATIRVTRDSCRRGRRAVFRPVTPTEPNRRPSSTKRAHVPACGTAGAEPRGEVSGGELVRGRRRSQWFSQISFATSRDFKGVLMPTGVAD
jgi:hypothetical protein